MCAGCVCMREHVFVCVCVCIVFLCVCVHVYVCRRMRSIKCVVVGDGKHIHPLRVFAVLIEGVVNTNLHIKNLLSTT